MHGTDGFPDGWWTPERIVLAVQTYAQVYGEPPTADAWHPAHARKDGRPYLAQRFYDDGCWPAHKTVFRVMGSWNAALEAAGFEPNPIGRRAGGPLPERCVRGHLWSEWGYEKTRPATAKRESYTVRVCRACQSQPTAMIVAKAVTRTPARATSFSRRSTARMRPTDLPLCSSARSACISAAV